MKALRSIVALVGSGLLLATPLLPAVADSVHADGGKVSRPGHYQGYSPVLYDGWHLDSVYVPMRDGTRIAIDIARPTRSGVLVDDKLPVVWMNTPYNRRPLGGKSRLETASDSPLDLVKYGYVVAVADYRGLYASFGKNRLYTTGEWVDPARTDAYDVTEWLARQPWSSGKIGMWGCSAQAGAEVQAATTVPPSLKAIFPLGTNFDAYELASYGGIQSPFPAEVGTSASRDVTASPVDGPDGPALLAQAKAEHADDPATNRDLLFRDSPSATLGEQWWKRSSPASFTGTIGEANIGVYAGGSWDDQALKLGPALLFANLPKGHAKLIFVPNRHCDFRTTAAQEGLAIQTEQLRFFDYWLKGVHNGIMDEPAVTYYTYNAPAGTEWRQSDTWPLANEQRTAFYLSGGTLRRSKPTAGGKDETAMGAPARSSSIMLEQAAGGLAYETAPLEGALEVTGHPVIRLWMSANTSDADVVAQLQDVAPDGSSRTYHMIGRLRASDRKLTQPPYAKLGLPHHSFLEADVQPLPQGQPVELLFDLLPMSYIFPKEHRIRLTVTFSNPDGGNGNATVWTGPAAPSQVVLPIIPAGS